MIFLFSCVPWNIQHVHSRSVQLFWNAHASLSVYLCDLGLSRKPSSRAQTGGWTWQWSWSPAETAPPAGRAQRDLKTLQDNQRKECDHWYSPSSSLQVCFYPVTMLRWYWLNIISQVWFGDNESLKEKQKMEVKFWTWSVICEMFFLNIFFICHMFLAQINSEHYSDTLTLMSSHMTTHLSHKHARLFPVHLITRRPLVFLSILPLVCLFLAAPEL